MTRREVSCSQPLPGRADCSGGSVVCGWLEDQRDLLIIIHNIIIAHVDMMRREEYVSPKYLQINALEVSTRFYLQGGRFVLSRSNPLEIGLKLRYLVR